MSENEAKYDGTKTPVRPTLHELEAVLRSGDQCEAAPKIRVALPGNAADDLRCMFFHGPTWDGNVPSKSGRDELVRMGLAARGQGWNWLTPAGVQACLDNGLHHEKERRESREQTRRTRIRKLAEEVLGLNPQSEGRGFSPNGEG